MASSICSNDVFRAGVVGDRHDVLGDFRRVRRLRFERGEEGDEGAVESLGDERLEPDAFLRLLLEQRLEGREGRARRGVGLRRAHARIVAGAAIGAVVQRIGAETLGRVPFAGARQGLGELLEGGAEIDEEPAVRLAVDDLLRFGVERRLLVIVDDELRHRAAAGLPHVLEDRGKRGPVAVVAGRDVDLRRLAEFLGQEMGENLALNVVRRDGLPYQRDRQAFIELGERGVGAAGEDHDVVGNGHSGRDCARHRRIEIADDHLHMVDVDELLRALDARLRAALAVLRIGQLDLDAGKVQAFQRLGDLVDAEPRRLVPSLPVRGGIAGQAGKDAVFQIERHIALGGCRAPGQCERGGRGETKNRFQRAHVLSSPSRQNRAEHPSLAASMAIAGYRG